MRTELVTTLKRKATEIIAGLESEPALHDLDAIAAPDAAAPGRDQE